MSDLINENALTCSELLMKCMEKFGEVEPTGMIVIWVDEKGITNWEYNRPPYQILGLLQVAANIIALQCSGFRGFSK